MEAIMEPLEKEDQQLLCVCEDLGRIVPGCELLRYEYSEWWTYGFPIPEEEQMEIRANIRNSTTPFLKEASEYQIYEMIQAIRPSTKAYLSQHLPQGYRYLFHRDRPYVTLPNDFVAPNIFQAISRREGSYIPLAKTIKRQYGNTIVELSGCLLSHYDALTMAVLTALKNYRKIERIGKSISFRTSLAEISECMNSTNPYSQSSQRAVWSSLKRLAGVVVEITNPDGKRTIGHILDGATEIDSLEQDGKLNSGAELQIFMDRYFLDLEEKNFTMLDLDNLQCLKSKARELCVYLFLSRQRDFYQKRRWWIIGLTKLHDYAGLRPEGKPFWLIRQELLTTLDGLKAKKILSWKMHDSQQKIAVHKGITKTKPDWSMGRSRGTPNHNN
jgi:hypothetical protein